MRLCRRYSFLPTTWMLVFRVCSSRRPFASFSPTSSQSSPGRTTSQLPVEQPPSEFGLISHCEHHNGLQNFSRDEYSSDVEKIYRILRRFYPWIPRLEQALQQSNVPMTPPLVERVLNRCGDAGNLGYRFFIWAAKQPGYKHTQKAYKSMIKILGKMRQFGAVWALLEEMSRENRDLVTPDVFVIIMRRFASARLAQKAVQMLDEMPKYGCQPDEYIFGCLLDALCKNGVVKEAAKLFEEMRERFQPSIKHYTSLLYGWCREGKLLEAKHVLVQLKEAGFEPDIVVYNNLLSGYTVARKFQDGYDLLKEMRLRGRGPNATSYTILIQALCGNEKLEEAMHLFVDMRRTGCAPDVVTYTTLISGFCRNRKIKTGYELLDSMIRQGCDPNQQTYYYILAAHEKEDQLEECLELVERMKKSGLIPDLNIYNSIIRMSCKLGELGEAVSAWHEIECNGLSPGTDTFIIMIHGFMGQGSLVEASGYIKEMIGRGLWSAPMYGTLKGLLNSLLRNGMLELAKEVWACIVSKGSPLNVYTWTIWIHALFSNRHVKEACSFCLDMLDSGLMPQPDTFAKLMRGLKKLYNRQIAAEITEKVRKMAAEMNVSFKCYKRRGVRLETAKVKAKRAGPRKKRGPRHWSSRPSRASIF